MYFTQARKEGNNHPTLYIVTILLLLLFNIFTRVIMMTLQNSNSSMFKTITNINNPAIWIVQLIIGLLYIGIIFFCVKIFHKKRIRSLVTASPHFRKTRLLKGAALWFSFMALSDLITWLIDPSQYIWTFNPRNITFMLIMIPTIIVLVSFEELLFRGYLLQGVALTTKNKIAAIIITAFLFGSAHLGNPEVQNFNPLFIIPQYYLMGLFFAVLVTLENGLEMVMGIHIINNLYGSLFIGFKGSVLPVPSFIQIKELHPALGLILLILFIAIFFIVYSIVAKRSEKNPWRDLIARIEK